MLGFCYVYVLRSLRDGGFYVGSTGNPKARISLHNRGDVRSTSPRRALKLIFYEAYPNATDAKRREIYLKSTKGRTTLKTMLRGYLAGLSDDLEKKGETK